MEDTANPPAIIYINTKNDRDNITKDGDDKDAEDDVSTISTITTPSQSTIHERKREIKQLEKSYMVLRERRETNANHTPRKLVLLEICYYYKLRDAKKSIDMRALNSGRKRNTMKRKWMWKIYPKRVRRKNKLQRFSRG